MERYARSLGSRRRAKGSRGRIARQPRHYLTLERLERRDLLTVLTWIGGDGNFNDPAHWAGGAVGEVPGLGDTALFSGGNQSVTISDGQQVDLLKLQGGANLTLVGGGLLIAGLASLDSSALIVQGSGAQLEITTDLVMSGASALTAEADATVLVGHTLDLGTSGGVFATDGIVYVGATTETALDLLRAPAVLAGRAGNVAFLAARDIDLNVRSNAVPISQATGGFSTLGLEARYREGARLDLLLLTLRDHLDLAGDFFSQDFLGDAALSYNVNTGKLRLDVPVSFESSINVAGGTATFVATGQLVAYAEVGLPGQALDFTTLNDQFDFIINPAESFLTFSGAGSVSPIGNFIMQPQGTGSSSLQPHFGGTLVATFTARAGAQPATIAFDESSLIAGIDQTTPYLPGPEPLFNGLQILPAGTLQGRGFVDGPLTNDGRIHLVAPTNDFPALSVGSGNYVQTDFGTLEVDVSPNYATSGSVLFVIQGAALLANDLRLNLLGDFSQSTLPLRLINPVSPGSTFAHIDGNRAAGTYFSVAPGPLGELLLVPQQAGLVVETSPNFYTDESGKPATFGVRLTAPPTAPVTVQIGTSDTSEGTATNTTGGNSLLFTVDNWNQPQTVIVTGVDDLLADGDISYFVNLHVVSNDPAYAGLADVRPPLVNRDNETSQEKLAAIRLKVTDAQGNVLPEVAVGQTFYLEMWVDDLRGEESGSLLAAYSDIIYSAARASVSGAAVFSADYPFDRSLSTVTNGLLDELGAATITELGSAERLLVRVPFVATSEGSLGFTANAAGGAGHGVRLAQLEGSLPPNRIEFGNTSVEVVPASGQSISIGQVVNGSIDAPGEVDEYQFTAAAGQSIFFDIQEIGGSGQFVDFVLKDPNGGTVMSTTAVSSSSSAGDLGPISLPMPGTYTLIADARGDDTAAYEFLLWDVPAAPVTTINIGQLVNGSIDTPGVVKQYEFTASAGQSIFFDIQEIGGSGQFVDFVLKDPNGGTVMSTTAVSNSSSAGDLGPISLPMPGTYTLIADARGDDTASYKFVVASASANNVLTWVGGDGNFNDPANWTGGALNEVPELGDTAVFGAGNHTITIGAGQQVDALQLLSGATVTFVGTGLLKAGQTTLNASSLNVQGDTTRFESTTTMTLAGASSLVASSGGVVLVGQSLDLGAAGNVDATNGGIFVGVTAEEALEELLAPGLLAAKLGDLIYITARDIDVAWRSVPVPIDQTTGTFSTDGIESSWVEGARVDVLFLTTRTTINLLPEFFPATGLEDGKLSYDVNTGKLRFEVPVPFVGTTYPFWPDTSLRIRFDGPGQLVAYADVGLPGQALDFNTLENQFDFIVDPQETFLDFTITGTAPAPFGNFTAEAQAPESLRASFGGKLVAKFTSRNGSDPATIQFLDTSVIEGVDHATPFLPGPLLQELGLQVLPDGKLTGRGTISGNVNNEGLIQLQALTGAATGAALTVTGNYVQSSFGTLQVDATPNYSAVAVALAVTGAANIENLLRLNLSGEFGNVTQPLSVIASPNRTGGFTSFEGNRSGTTYFSLDSSLPNLVNVVPQQVGLVVETTPDFFTDEAGKTATFGVKLRSAPTAPVTVQLGTSDSSEGTATNSAGGNALVFTEDNWNQLQTVIVTGINDLEADGDISYFVNLHVVSEDFAYAGLTDVRPPLVNRDNEPSQEKLAAIRLKVTNVDGLEVSEVTVGQKFNLELWVDDLRGEISGSILAAYADVVYSAARASLLAPASFSSDFPLDRSLSTLTAGLLDEFGAATSAELGSAERRLASVSFVATSEGLLGFTANAAGGAGHGVRLSELAGSLPPNRVDFGNTSVNVVAANSGAPNITLHDATATAEGNAGLTPINFQVELSQVPTAPVTVFYRVFASGGDTATADVDFVAETGSITFTPTEGVRFKNIVAQLKGDSYFETAENFHVEITGIEGPGNVVRATALGTIQNDDIQAVVSIANAPAKVEGNDGETPFTFQVSLSNAIEAPVTVFYRVIAGTGNSAALPGQDFTAFTDSITFDPASGPQSQNIVALVRADALPELNENFRVELTRVTGLARLGQTVGIGTILNDDAPDLLLDDVQRFEGTGGSTSFTFRVRLSQQSDDVITVLYQIGENPVLGIPVGTATPGVDYAAGAGFLTFNPGVTEQSFTVSVVADDDDEGNETFFVGLYDLRNERVGPVRRATIVDDDPINTPVNTQPVDFDGGHAEIEGEVGGANGGSNGGSGELVELLLTELLANPEQPFDRLTGAWDFVRFTLERPTIVRIEVIAERLPLFGGAPSDLDAVLALLSLDNTNKYRLRATNDDTIGRDPVIELELTAGTYVVGVTGAQGTRGPYRLMIDLDAPPVVDRMTPGNTVAGSPTVLTLFLNDVDVDLTTVLRDAFELYIEDPITKALSAIDDALGDPQYLSDLHRILVPIAGSLVDARYYLGVRDRIASVRGGQLRSATPGPEDFAFMGSFAVDTTPPVLVDNTLRVGGATSTAAGLLYRLVGELDDAAPATTGEQVRVELDIDNDGEFDDGFATWPLEADGATSFSVSALTELPFSGGEHEVAVRFVDARGNTSGRYALTIDTNLPIVTDVRAADGDRKVLVSFSRGDLLNIDQAANYTVTQKTSNAVISRAIVAVAVLADRRTVELTLEDMPDGVYTLSVHTGAGQIFAPGQATTELVASRQDSAEPAQAELNAELEATDPVFLDGNFDGTPGDDFTGGFLVDRTGPTITNAKLQDAPGTTNHTRSVQTTLLVSVEDVFPGAPLDSPLTLSIDLDDDDDDAFDNGSTSFTLRESGKSETVAIQINRLLVDGTYNARFRLVDAAGNVAPEIADFMFTVDRLGPKIMATRVEIESTSAGRPTGIVTVTLEFDENLDKAAAQDLLTYRLLSAGGDDNLYDADPGTDQTDAITSLEYQPDLPGGRSTVTIGIDLTGRPDDIYQLVVEGERLIDLAGNRLVGGDYRVGSQVLGMNRRETIQWSAQTPARVMSVSFASSSINGASPVSDLIVLEFSGPDLIESQVENLANYTLVRIDAPAGPVEITSVSYDARNDRAILRLSTPVSTGSYELTIRAGTAEAPRISSVAKSPLLGRFDLVAAGDIELFFTPNEVVPFQQVLQGQFPSLAQYVDQVTLDAANSRKTVSNVDFANRLLQELQAVGSSTESSAEVAGRINDRLSALIVSQLGGIEADKLADQGEFMVVWAREARFIVTDPATTNAAGDSRRVGRNANDLLVQEIPGATLVQVETADGPLMLVILPIDPRTGLIGNERVTDGKGGLFSPNFRLNLELEDFSGKQQAGYLLVHEGQVDRKVVFTEDPQEPGELEFKSQEVNLAPTINGIDPNIAVINQRVQEIVESIFGPLNQLTRNLLWGWIDPVDFVLRDGQSQGTFAVSQGQVGSVPANGAITFNGATGLLLWSGAPSGDYSLGLTGVGTTYRGALNFNNGTQSFFAPVQGELGFGRTLAAQIDFGIDSTTTVFDLGDVAFALRAGTSSAGGLLGSTLSPAIRALASAGGELGVGGVLRSLSQMASHVGRRGENPLGKLLEELLRLRRRVASSPMHQWLLPAVEGLIDEWWLLNVSDIVGQRRIKVAIQEIERQLSGQQTTAEKPVIENAGRGRHQKSPPAATNDEAAQRNHSPQRDGLMPLPQSAPDESSSAPTSDSANIPAVPGPAGQEGPESVAAATASTAEGSSDASR